MLAPEQRQQQLDALAARIEAQGLVTPAQMLLDVMAPCAVLASQCALFLRPFAPDERWRAYAELFGDSASWQELRSLLDY